MFLNLVNFNLLLTQKYLCMKSMILYTFARLTWESTLMSAFTAP
jgi:hypothetical protein